MALAIGPGYDCGLVGPMMAALDISFGGSKCELGECNIDGEDIQELRPSAIGG